MGNYSRITVLRLAAHWSSYARLMQICLVGKTSVPLCGSNLLFLYSFFKSVSVSLIFVLFQFLIN